MSSPGNNIFGSGLTPIVPTQSIWQWNTSGIASGMPATVTGYPVGISNTFPTGYANTKTGLQPWDLKKFVGVPIMFYGPTPCVVDDNTILEWIRYAEDSVEQESSLLLCQTWVASPPAQQTQIAQAMGIQVQTSAGYQIRGYDYDLEDTGYDFMFQRARDEGWMFLTLRYRPVQSLTYGVSGTGSVPATQGITAVKNTAFIYPLLNQYFRMPVSWNVEDRDYGYIRYVPATNTQMLPLFAMQLAFMGFAESVPNAIWLQYTAGLTPYDLQTRFSFVKQLVLAKAAIQALSTIQGTINLGAKSMSLTVDGMQYRTDYDPRGPYAGLIDTFEKQEKMLMKRVMDKVSGPMMNYF